MSARPERRITRRRQDRREARIREAEKAIRWTLDFCRTDLPSTVIRRGAEALADGQRLSRKPTGEPSND